MSKFKAIGFDYGGVIGGQISKGFHSDVAKILGMDLEEFRSTYFSLNHLVNEGTIPSWSEFWKVYLTQLNKLEKLEDVLTLGSAVGRRLQQVNQDVLALIDRLRTRNYKTGLLTNNTKEMADYLRSRAIDQHFDVIHVSSETKLMKPRAEAFAFFTKALQVQPPELIFVDDSEQSLSTAGQIGYTPILFTSYSELRQALTDLGIL